MTNNFDKGRFLNLDKFENGVGVSPQKVRVRVSPWMINYFDKGRFFNLSTLKSRVGVSPRKVGVGVSPKVTRLTLFREVELENLS